MRPLRSLATALLAFVLALAATDVFVRGFYPTSARLGDNFSSAYLQMELGRLRAQPPATIFLGDSVLWGYKLRADQSAPARLAAAGGRDVNLAYEGGSPVNTYAMLELLLARGVRPARIVFNVNQKVFNAADSAYARVHPSVAPLALPLFSRDDATLLDARPPDATPEARLDAAVAATWRLYALRTDLRESLFGDVDAAHALHDVLEDASGARARTDAAHAPTPDRFEGTYDLTPLDASNVSVHFLARIVARLHAAHVPALAILTPTNHTLLHDYIDNREYRRNLAYVRRLLERGGIRTIDLDRAFAPSEFIDNDHLTARANERFARTIGAALDAR